MEIAKVGRKDNSKRRYPGIGGSRHNPVGKAARAKSDEDPKKSVETVRQEAWAKLGPKGQLAAIEARIKSGKDKGESKKQRARLQGLIDNPRVAKKEAVPQVAEALETGSGGRLKAKERKTTERAKRPGAASRQG